MSKLKCPNEFLKEIHPFLPSKRQVTDGQADHLSNRRAYPHRLIQRCEDACKNGNKDFVLTSQIRLLLMIITLIDYENVIDSNIHKIRVHEL